MALGAPRARLAGDMMLRPLGAVLLGELAGIPATVWLATVASELLYRVTPRDPAVLGAVALFVFGVSLGAGLWPAWCALNGEAAAPLHTA